MAKTPSPYKPPPSPYDGKAFDDPVLQRMWEGKDFRKPEVFAHATLTRTIEVHAMEGEADTVTIDKGTRVICTMVSRFGDVGIRARHINERRNGYDARVAPEDLTDIVEFKKGTK
jgi:hypothetical protein